LDVLKTTVTKTMVPQEQEALCRSKLLVGLVVGGDSVDIAGDWWQWDFKWAQTAFASIPSEMAFAWKVFTKALTLHSMSMSRDELSWRIRRISEANTKVGQVADRVQVGSRNVAIRIQLKPKVLICATIGNGGSTSESRDLHQITEPETLGR
jgi:hypothetical protein